MTPNHNENGGLGQIPDLKRWILWPVALIFLVIAAIYAFSTSFSYFSKYDDEGFLMISVRGCLDGHRLYDDVLTYYGPAYYVYEWFIHTVVSLPLTHDVTRAICIFHWLAAASLIALAGGLMTRSPLVGFFIFMQATLHLTPLAREPGHPQELVALILPLAVLATAGGLPSRWIPMVLGAIAATLVFTKINVGVFFGFGLMLALCCQASLFQSRRVLFWCLLAVSGLMPLLLMRPHLAEPWARVFCGQACITILASGAAAYALDRGCPASFAPTLQAGAGFAGLSAIIVAILLLAGSTLSSTVENLVTGPSRLGNAFYYPLVVPHSSWSGAAAFLAAATLLMLRSRLDRMQPIISVAKGLYGLLGTLLLVNDYNSQLGYLWPWTWLLLIRTSTDRPCEMRDIFARTFLCLEAAWQGLQAYPTAGTQAVVATVLPVLVFSLCLHDAIIAFASAPWAARHLRNLAPRTAVMLKTLALAGLLCLFGAVWCKPLASWRYYASVPPLGLPGGRHLRLPGDQVDTYRALAQYLETECDTFITIPGLNSLYFWTGKTPPTYFNASEVVLLNDGQQAQVVVALQKARRPLIVVNGDKPVHFVSVGPLARLIFQQCREIKRIGIYHILEPDAAAGFRR